VPRVKALLIKALLIMDSGSIVLIKEACVRKAKRQRPSNAKPAPGMITLRRDEKSMDNTGDFSVH
jgi:hypothetical protein